jgi:3-dehydroquinate dehydratase/shikimate dehydrogenase
LKGLFFGLDVGRTLLCETVTGDTTAALRAARDRSSADLVELRLDGVADPDVALALAGRVKPVVVTCRPRWEGGLFDGSEAERRALLARAQALGADYVDVEWRAGFDDLIQAAPGRVLLSVHDFEGVPADLASRVRAMRATGAGLIKVAVMARALADVTPLREIARSGPAVVVAMGEVGVVSRLLAGRVGSRWTYAGEGVAPGQMPADRMLDEFRFRQVGPGTRLFGVVSRHAMHSVSPAMHNAAFGAAGLDAVYVPLTTTSFQDFAAFADAMGIEGVSVTIPFKLDALAAARQADATATAVGAANTLRREAGGWAATNTDVEGFLAPLDEVVGGPVGGLRASVLGGGGAARAVVFALRSRGAAVTVHARRGDQAREVALALGAAVGPWPPPAGSWDLLVNATPLGGATRRDESPLPGGPFGGGIVYDLTYGPGESRLLREAREAGCRTLDGLAMLVAQAEQQFTWWTGVRPGQGVMRAAAARRAGGAPQARDRAHQSAAG